MLWYLRGEVPELHRTAPSSHNYEGILYGGDSPHATRKQLVAYASRTRTLWSVVTGRPEREYQGRFTARAEDVTDLFTTEDYTYTAAWTAADIVAAGSMRWTCPAPTEDDKFDWGWGEGPPDHLWQATRKAFRVVQASMVRRIFAYPNIATPTTGSDRPERYIPPSRIIPRSPTNDTH